MVKAQQGTSLLKPPSSETDLRDTDLQVLSRLDPSNRQVRSLLQLSKQVRSSPVHHWPHLTHF